LFKKLTKKHPAAGYVRRLLAATARTARTARTEQGTGGPLSDRELDVLLLLGTTLTSPTSPALHRSR
jgi:hypothetical protein